jgi:NAD(P)-dependent dehydrogenase (short-subunit alcohol dehydrogenase family)
MNRRLRKELSLLAGLAAVGLLFNRNKSLSLAMGLVAVGLRLVPQQAYALENRVAIITGGSRGLGLAIAEELLHKGARVALLARDAEELDRAKAKLEKLSEQPILTIPCDLTEPDELRAAFSQVESRFGRIDILVNNAGTISVGPFETMDKSDFDALLDLQVHAVIQAIRLALPSFRRNGGGRVVNISSIGGRIPVPHMSSYCVGKFALAGLSESIAAELAPDNVIVTTVYPGLMRTGSPIQAVFKGDCEREYGWFAASDVMPGISVSARYAARKIVEGLKNGDASVVFPWVTRFGILGHSLFPETYALIMRIVAGLLPKSNARLRQTGAQSQGWLERQLWYKPLQKRAESAERRFNQVEKLDAEFNLGV